MRPGRSGSSRVSWNESTVTSSARAISAISSLSLRIFGSASGQPLFQGRRSTRRTGSPSSLPRRTIARRFSAAAATERPWAMSLIPPCTTSRSAPTAHSSRRTMISSVRWPWIPQFRNSSRVSACAAQCSHWLVSSPPLRESYPGEPSEIESPSATTTIGSAAWIRLLRDLLGHAVILLDDVVALALADDGLDSGNLVTGMHREPTRIGTELLVFSVAHRDALDTRGVTAFADEIERLRLHVERLGDTFDALVDLSEHRLVEPDLFLAGAHDTSFSTTT